MPNAFVFPGGVLAKEDLHPGWNDLLPKPLKPPPEGPRPLLMQPVEQGEGLSRHIAFRWLENTVPILEWDPKYPKRGSKGEPILSKKGT